MKKHLIAMLLVVLITPSIALASWWNPFTWKIFNKKVITPQSEVQKNSNEKINELQKQLDDLKKSQVSNPSGMNIATKEIKNNSSATKTEIKLNQFSDVCLNIEGVQSQVPSGYSSVSSICSPIDTKDYCPNLHGVQLKIPEGRTFYRSTSECLTEKEIEIVENLESQKSARIINCNRAKQEVVTLNQEIAELYTQYNKDYDFIVSNPGGMLISGMNAQLQNLSQRYNSDKNAINTRISIAQAEVQLYCD